MSVDSATLAGREVAESRMRDQCIVVRPSPAPGQFDPETGTTTKPSPTPVYDGACRVKVLSLTDRPAVAGDHDYTVQQSIISLPISANVTIDDLLTVTASELDPSLENRTFVIGAVDRGSQITARRFVANEVTS